MLRQRGFCYGRMQRGAPRGILFGNEWDIQKWRNLSPDDIKALHGIMTGGREGPVTITIYASAPDEALKAFEQEATP